MLSELVKTRLEKDGLSAREAARQIGLAHTTVARIIGGEQIDLSTYIQTCNWLRVNPADVLKSEGKLQGRSKIAAGVASLIQVSPSLEPIFEEIVTKFEAGEVTIDIVNDLIHYAAFRLGVRPPGE